MDISLEHLLVLVTPASLLASAIGGFIMGYIFLSKITLGITGIYGSVYLAIAYIITMMLSYYFDPKVVDGRTIFDFYLVSVGSGLMFVVFVLFASIGKKVKDDISGKSSRS